MVNIALPTGFSALLLAALVLGEEHLFHFKVREGIVAPDNFPITSLLINDHYVGPEIKVTTGDSLKITVENNSHRPLSFHWHGISQESTNQFDGVPYLTQSPIQPGKSFDYSFNVGDQAGTFWYHATTGVDSELAYGALIVNEDQDTRDKLAEFNRAFDYDDEKVILLSEQWHRNSQDIFKGITQKPFVTMGPPDSVLINGHSYMKWDGLSDHPTNKGYEVISVKPFRSYRLRLIGANGHSHLAFRIPNHKFTVIEIDGTYINPIEVEYVEIDAGQRISVILTTDKPIKNYPIHAQIQGKNVDKSHGLAYLHYEGAPSAEPLRKKEEIVSYTEPDTRWEEARLTSYTEWYNTYPTHHFYNIPTRVNKEFVLNITHGVVDDIPRFLINNRYHPNYNVDLFNPNNKHVLESLPNLMAVELNDVVQIIFQQYSANNKPCVRKPWHLHGHSFHVLGGSEGTYDTRTSREGLNEYVVSGQANSVFRDSFTQFPADAFYLFRETYEVVRDPSYYHGVTNCGWYAIRFRANNLGLWALESQVTAYRLRGLKTILQVKPRSNKTW